MSYRAEILLTQAGIGATVAVAIASTWSLADWFLANIDGLRPGLLVGQAVFVAGGTVLLYNSWVYLVARLGYLRRCRDFRPASRADLASLYEGDTPRLVVLVPSYREDPHLVRMTLMSAALQAFPRHRVVLLIDDPPDPDEPEARERLHAVRRIPAELQRALDVPAARMTAARRGFRSRMASGLDLGAETRHLADLWDGAARWVEREAAGFAPQTHVDRFFRRQVLEELAAQHRAEARRLRWRAEHDPLDATSLERTHRELDGLFAVELDSFERKRWANLSHAPNKAMNLNSYLQLLGTIRRRIPGPDGPDLLRDPGGDVHVPDADYVITLDADSQLLPGYALRLVHRMERPGNERVGLVQTPYSAFPEAPGPVERVAGATTDLMCLVHQGSSAHDAAYWVGANAVVRVAALRDIAVEDDEDGRPITRFIRDRTLVEDTESTIDLVRCGWRLVNHPARLSYSATPPDFGSLLIQRRRWANGGLLVLPGFLQSVRERPPRRRQLTGTLMRLNYLTSLAAVNLALLVLMAFPFEGVYAPVWLSLMAVPYFALSARDLVQAGYRLTDVARVYALTLLLVPVHLGGVVKSLWQAWSGSPTSFRRTPTIPARTPVPALYVVLTFLLVASWLFTTLDDLGNDRNLRAVFTFLNVTLLLYAVTRFLGWRAALGDLWLRITGRASRWVRRPTVGPDHRRRLRHRPLAVVGRIALIPVLVVGGLTAHAWLAMDNVPVDGLSSWPLGRMNVLVAGIDSREGFTADQRRELSLGNFDGARADTLFVLSVDGDRAAMLAFPRDLYTQRCDGSRGRINEALDVGGPSCLVETVEAVSGISIGHYVEMDVAGLVQVVDGVGGVGMALEQPIRDHKSGADLPAGHQRLTGRQALAFVRARSMDDDLGRIGRQQDFVRALARKVGRSAPIRDPLSTFRLVDAVAGALAVDRDTGPIDLARLGRGVSRAVDRDQFVTRMVPTRPVEIAGKQLLAERREPAARLYRNFATGSVHATASRAAPAPRDGR